MDHSSWYYSQNRQRIGPFSWPQLQQLAAQGQLKPENMVLQEGAQKWQEARSVPGLFPGGKISNVVSTSISISGNNPGLASPTFAPNLMKGYRRKCLLVGGTIMLLTLIWVAWFLGGAKTSSENHPLPTGGISAAQKVPDSLPQPFKAGKEEKKKPPNQTPEVGKPKQIPAKPNSIEEMKQAIRFYLQKKSGKVASGDGVPDKSPWVWCGEQYLANKKNPKELYRLIGEHLLIADKRYLNSQDVETRRKGLGMAFQACQCSTHTLLDKWLSVQITEAYLEPHLEDADPRHWKYLGKQQILEGMASAYAEARDADKYMEILKRLIYNAHNRNTADGARMRLAQMLDRKGQYEEAIRCLQEIDEKAGVGGARRLIPDIEKKLKMKQKKEKSP